MGEYSLTAQIFGALVIVGVVVYALYRVYKSGKGPGADRLRDTVDKIDKKK